MEVEQRLRGRIVRRPKEQVWMLKTDSVLIIKNIDIDIEHRQCQYQYSKDKCGRPKEQVWMLKTDSVLNIINIYINKAQTNSKKWI